jgi:hypothetical protein
MAGMMLCVMACCLVLLDAGKDQTGLQLLAVAESFDDSLTGNSMSEESNSAKLIVWKPTDDSEDTAQIEPTTAWRQFGVNERAKSFESDERQRVDINASRYGYLLRELKRFSEISDSMEFSGEVRIDLLTISGRSDRQLAKLIHTSLLLIEEGRGPGRYEVDVILWSPSPRRSDVAGTALRAAQIQRRVNDSLRETPQSRISLRSSARLWNDRDHVRPEATLAVKRLFQEGG